MEGHDSASILDVVYFTHTIESDKGDCNNDSYTAAMEGVADKEREIKHVEFRKEAVEQQKKMLKQFASHITDLQSSKVV